MGRGGDAFFSHLRLSPLHWLTSQNCPFQSFPHPELCPDNLSSAPRQHKSHRLLWQRLQEPRVPAQLRESPSLHSSAIPIITNPHGAIKTTLGYICILGKKNKKKTSPFLSVLFNHHIFWVWLWLTTPLFVKSVLLVEHFSRHIKTPCGRVDQVRGSNSTSGSTTLRAEDERGLFSRRKEEIVPRDIMIIIKKISFSKTLDAQQWERFHPILL